MNYSFCPSESTRLCEIMGRNESDKGHENILASRHNYTTFYYSIFNELSEKPLRLFELGLGTNNVNLASNMGPYGRPGASLYGWREFFPNAQIFGADIDRDILFNTDRIKTFYCDQTNPDIIKAMWEEPVLEENFDIIIDDGLHTFDANVCFFENSIHKLNPGGYFIIEDVTIGEYHLFINKFEEWENKNENCEVNMINIPSIQNAEDNRLVVIYKSS